ncbi:MAG: RNA polymerase sigma-70 factor [Chitinophagaceae bacterium]|nr:MAG: RNA polymerase sigma-70 factor [Chitinophagaceae bacterium]
MNQEKEMAGFSMDAFRQGDEHALDILFRKFFPALSYFAGHFLDNTLMADDIASETFLKIWAKRQDFESPDHIRAFLYRATRNACINHRIQSERSTARETAFSEKYQDDALFDAKIVESEVIRSLLEAIEGLPQECRKVIRLSFIEGMKADEIAQKLQVSLSTVKSQKARGIELLRKRLPNSLLQILLFM